VFTIHNLALQGGFDGGFARHFTIPDQQLVTPLGVPRHLAFSAMAQGVLHADRINTVSETYARELCADART